ncbi:hypothetical protein M5689_020485 [Euphorbia peplus]|nr:hypothetical protein M5689_020485 [Euphorbia peplus]
MTSLRFHLVLALAVSGLLVEPINGNIFVKDIRVKVLNEYLSPSILYVHCKSRDDDMGKHWVPRDHDFNWKFTPSMWGNTLFSCFTSPNNDVHAKFVAFRDRESLTDRCDHVVEPGVIVCTWVAKLDGMNFREAVNITTSIDTLEYGWVRNKKVEF